MEETTGLTEQTAQVSWFQQNWGSLVLWGVILAIALVLVITKWGPLAKFIRETRTELGKCSWPWDMSQPPSRRYQELITSTCIVIVGMIILGAYTSLFDYLFGSGVRWLMSH